MRCKRHLDAAFLGVAGALVHSAASNVMPVFGQIGQMAEVGKGPNHAHGLLAAQTFEEFLQGLVGFVVGMTAKCHRQFADVFDQFKSGRALLLADHIAQYAAE